MVYYVSFFFMMFHLLLFLMFISFLSGGLVFSFNFLTFFNIYFDFSFVVDWVSCGFSSTVMLISSVVFIYSVFYLGFSFPFSRFIYLLFLFVISMIFLVFSPNMFSIMVGWDGLGIVSFLLVIYYNNFSSLRSGLITLFTNRLGDMSLLVSFYFFFISNSWDFSSFYISDSFFFMYFIIFCAMTKSAQFPFSAWLPAAMAAPTPVSSLVHSSTLVTAGVYLLIRFYYCFSFFISSWSFSFISSLTVFLSGIMAFFELDMKKVIALSTLSQLGMMMYSLSLGEWMFSYFHMICHALFKALLFLSCGFFINFSYGGQDLRMKGGYYSISPFIGLMFLFASISLCGFPFMSGFFSKDFILEVSLTLGWNFLNFLVFIIGCLFSLVYSIRLFVYGLLVFYMNFSFFSNFYGNLYMYMIFYLSIWAMMYGSIVSFFLFLDSFFVIFSFFKLIGLMVMFLGMAFYFVLSFMNFNMYLLDCFSDMFYLFWFSSWPFSIWFKKIGLLMEYDMMWVEMFGPKGGFNLVLQSSNYFVSYEWSWYKMYMVFFGLIFCVFFCLMFI